MVLATALVPKRISRPFISFFAFFFLDAGSVTSPPDTLAASIGMSALMLSHTAERCASEIKSNVKGGGNQGRGWWIHGTQKKTLFQFPSDNFFELLNSDVFVVIFFDQVSLDETLDQKLHD